MIDDSTFAEVAVNKPLDQTFTYKVPDNIIKDLSIGSLVIIPWGRKQTVGCVTKLNVTPAFEVSKIKTILSIASPGYCISEDVINLAKFITQYYGSCIGESLSCASMIGFKDIVDSSPETFCINKDFDRIFDLTKKQKEVYHTIQNTIQRDTIEGLAKQNKVSRSVIEKLIEKDALQIDQSKAEFIINDSAFQKLNEEQEQAYQKIKLSCDNEIHRVFLLHGITGSGKTEIYLHLIRDMLKLGKTALFLVPEISLTPQMLERFEERFVNCVGIYHSQMTFNQKRRLQDQINEGTVKLVIGARSAVFSDLPNLGIIIVDEEHEGSYKQNETPRYHARDLAVYRANKQDIPIVLGSATPSLESYYHATTGKYDLLELKERATKQPLPDLSVIDLGKEIKESKTPTLISEELKKQIKRELENKKQVILFLNRRGYSHFQFCPKCNWVARCPNDDMTYTVHQKKRTKAPQELEIFQEHIESNDDYFLKCHYCHEDRKLFSKCQNPDCQNEKLSMVGIGTQRIETILEEDFSEYQIIRVDQDTVSSRQRFLETWDAMTSGRAQLILGTQMLAKGLHLEGVTLVGLVLADLGLFQPDFRATERVFSLITQVAGRAGRTQAGSVVLQTYMPHQPAIRFGRDQDYLGFYEDEIKRRQQLHYPPFSRISNITISSPDRDDCYRTARDLAYAMRKHMPSVVKSPAQQKKFAILGPTIPPVARHDKSWRYRIMLRSSTSIFHAPLFRAAKREIEKNISSKTRITLDVDAFDFF